MDYEEITANLILNVMKEFKLETAYEEFLDSIVDYKDFSKVNFNDFKEYLNDRVNSSNE